jgi:hypothetical protein
VILICGVGSESPVRAAIAAAERAGAEHLVLDQRHAEDYDVTLELRRGRLTGALEVRGEQVPLTAFRGVYTRVVDSGLLPQHQGPYGERQRVHAHAVQQWLDEWLEAGECRVANRSSAMASNLSKPYQARLIAESGFAVPATIVTNQVAELEAFASVHGRLVYKSVSSVRSIVQELTPQRAGRLDRLRRLPTQFQEHVEGVDVRVHVVGPQVFATEIASKAIDYRYASRDELEIEMTAVTLPSRVERGCRLLAAALDLPFCGIDLRRRPDGSYVCFEVNPSPAYTFYEDTTGQPISDALVAYLAHG